MRKRIRRILKEKMSKDNQFIFSFFFFFWGQRIFIFREIRGLKNYECFYTEQFPGEYYIVIQY